MVEVMKIMMTSLKRSQVFTATLSAPNPEAGHTDPGLHWRLPDTHGLVQDSLL